MGLNHFSCGYTDDNSNNVPQPPNPNPHEFTIKSIFEINGHCLLYVNYPACTTYSGNKLILFKNTKITDLPKDVLDPHFLKSQPNLFARFAPTEEGFKAAKAFMEIL
jgi:hypothetical protein